jgi:hypothetical protein
MHVNKRKLTRMYLLLGCWVCVNDAPTVNDGVLELPATACQYDSIHLG